MTPRKSALQFAPIAVFEVDRLPNTLTLAGLRGLTDRVLLDWLRKQRWFGAKGSAESARVIDVIPLPWDSQRIAIAIVEVVGGGSTSRYQLPLSIRGIDAETLAAGDSRSVIANVHAADGNASLIDGTCDPVFQRGLGAAFITPTSFASPSGSTWKVEATSKNPMVFRPHADIVMGPTEQSNSSLIYDRQAFLKLFRKLESGIHPDVEMTRFLTVEAGFPHVPSMFGTISYVNQDGGSVAGMLQEYVAGSRDAWSFLLENAKAGAAPAAAMRDMEKLGQTTREMHEALAGTAAVNAGDAFAPISAKAVDVERWAQRTKETIREATGLLDKQRGSGKLSKARSAEAEVLIRRRDHYLAWIEEVADLIGDDGGARIRIHGDYHLGQVLRTMSDSFVIIDFEGDTTRPIAERREKASALRDVAGMLRSLAYAAATMVNVEKGANDDPRSAAERELISGRWERDARAAFLRGYTGWMRENADFLPTDPKKFDALLSLFEAERAFYELSYELNHRPGWEWIPMRGISKLLVKV